MVLFIRFESAMANRRGRRPGVFAMANGLAHNGQLTAAEWAWWRANNDWMDAAYPDPATVVPGLFDMSRHPVIECWFKETARHLLARVPGYLELLDRHGVAWVERRTSSPGRILYDDSVQVVVVPDGIAGRR